MEITYCAFADVRFIILFPPAVAPILGGEGRGLSVWRPSLLSCVRRLSLSLGVDASLGVLAVTVLCVSTSEMRPRGSWRPFAPHTSRHTRMPAHTPDTSGVDGASSCRHDGGGGELGEGEGVGRKLKPLKEAEERKSLSMENRGEQSKGGGSDQSVQRCRGWDSEKRWGGGARG